MPLAVTRARHYKQGCWQCSGFLIAKYLSMPLLISRRRASRELI